jgi:hypothetical protein
MALVCPSCRRNETKLAAMTPAFVPREAQQ